MVFHPPLHERELLAGETVALATDCQSCGQTLSMSWALPNAGELRAQAAAARVESLPVAAGAEGWSRALPTAPTAPTAPGVRPGLLFRDALPERTPAPARALRAAPADPAMSEFLTQFTERIDRARRHLGQASVDLPSAISGELRRPKLARTAPVETHALSSS
ncbi:MAG: hypothetical protein H7287_04965, partial [Thermoleophilia bacterium]|nr:hypothetical protein [Thermoleophilia bacterium]